MSVVPKIRVPCYDTPRYEVPIVLRTTHVEGFAKSCAMPKLAETKFCSRPSFRSVSCMPKLSHLVQVSALKHGAPWVGW